MGERKMSETSIDTHSNTKTTTDNMRKIANNTRTQDFKSIGSKNELVHIPNESSEISNSKINWDNREK